MSTTRLDTITDQLPADVVACVHRVDFSAYNAAGEATSRLEVAIARWRKELKKLGRQLSQARRVVPIKDPYPSER